MSVTLTVGSTQQMAAQLVDHFGGTLYGLGAPIWSSSDPSIVSVNAVGVATGVALGSAEISATLGGVRGHSTVTVTAFTTIVSDAFVRADSASSLGSADTGQAWSLVGAWGAGTWGIQSNHGYLAVDGLNNQDSAVVDSLVANCTVAMTLSTNPGAGGRLVWRATDKNNYFLALCVTTTLNIYRLQAGGFNQLANPAVTFADGDVISVVLSGDSHVVQLNGTTVFSFTDAFQNTATKHGIGTTTTTTTRWSLFVVTVP